MGRPFNLSMPLSQVSPYGFLPRFTQASVNCPFIGELPFLSLVGILLCI